MLWDPIKPYHQSWEARHRINLGSKNTCVDKRQQLQHRLKENWRDVPSVDRRGTLKKENAGNNAKISSNEVRIITSLETKTTEQKMFPKLG